MPVTLVNNDSKVEHLVISNLVPIPSSEESREILINLDIIDDGEFEVRISVRLYTGTSELFHSRVVGLVVENGVAWFGNDAVDEAIRNKLRANFEQKYGASNPDLDEIIEFEFQQEMLKRASLAKLNRKDQASPTSKPTSSGKDDEIIIKAFWQGPGPGYSSPWGRLTDFPMNGVKIIVSDKTESPVPDIVGYLSNGEFRFKAPYDYFSYDVTIESRFGGILANGEIDPQGNGIGAFDLVHKYGYIYKCKDEDTVLIVCDSLQMLGTYGASSWSVLHGVAELVYQAKSRLNVNKAPGFKVYYPGNGTHYKAPNISIKPDDSYDWDVIGHEFGHAVLDEENATDGNVGGKHNGSNQYDYIPNIYTYQDKEPSLGLALDEGVATWIGSALLEQPRAVYAGRFQNIGDGTYNDTKDTSKAHVFEKNNENSWFGEDTEHAIFRLMWDIMDAENEVNFQATCFKCADSFSLALDGLWRNIDGSQVSNISEFWHHILDVQFNTSIPQLDGSTSNDIDSTKLLSALRLGYSFAEFGIAPYLVSNDQNPAFDLTGSMPGPQFSWDQLASGGQLPKLNEFSFVLYSPNLKKLIFKKDGISKKRFAIRPEDAVNIRTALNSLSSSPGKLVAAIFGKNSVHPVSGPYLSNPIEVKLINSLENSKAPEN
ncbi:MAG: hypothetical protein AAF431_04170 [Pseudomonadota bacterium]